MQLRKTWPRAITLVALLVTPCLATGPLATNWPLERITANLEERLRISPDDSRAHYNLGRAHAFAFALERSSLWAIDERPHLANPADRGLQVIDLEDQRRRARKMAARATPSSSELLEHLEAGVRHLRRACEIEEHDVWWATPKHLTLAWLLETGAHLADRIDTPSLFAARTNPLPSDVDSEFEHWISDLGADDEGKASAAQVALMSPRLLADAMPLLWSQRCSSNAKRQKAVARLLERFWIEKAIEEYWRTFELGLSDIWREGVSIERGKKLEDLVSYEALDSYRRLVLQRGVQGPEEEKRLAEAAETWKRVEAMPRRGWITPLLISMDGCNSLDELATPNLTVPFDLDGDAVDELWPWISPDAGWLVWDPEHRGEITSGRQLFGTASAWLFFEDGYRVLDALDDDRDGELRGAELAGISVWFDRDTDGVSDRGEVVPVEELGIVALSTQATMQVGASPANLCGMEMSDGRVLPTYDWVLASVEGP